MTVSKGHAKSGFHSNDARDSSDEFFRPAFKFEKKKHTRANETIKRALLYTTSPAVTL